MGQATSCLRPKAHGAAAGGTSPAAAAAPCQQEEQEKQQGWHPPPQAVKEAPSAAAAPPPWVAPPRVSAPGGDTQQPDCCTRCDQPPGQRPAPAPSTPPAQLPPQAGGGAGSSEGGAGSCSDDHHLLVNASGTDSGGCASLSSSSGAAQEQRFDPQLPPPNPLLGCCAVPGGKYVTAESGPPRPPCDEERLEAAARLGPRLDAAPRKELENILRLVCNIFGVENALIALFGDRRIFILDSVGGFQRGDFNWRWSFCGWTMASEQHSVMVIQDAKQDERFRDNQYVLGGGVRFYCGSPLVSSSGHRLGTLCFADLQPRVFDTSSLQILVNFSELVTRELEKDIALAEQQAAASTTATCGDKDSPQYQLLLRSVDCVTSAVLVVDTSKPGWPVVHANSGWARLASECRRAAARPLLPAARGVGGGGGGAADLFGGEGKGLAASAQAPFGRSRHEGFLDACGACGAAPQPRPRQRQQQQEEEDDGDVVGRSLWSLLDPRLAAQIGGGANAGIAAAGAPAPPAGAGAEASACANSAGWLAGGQVVQQIKGRQSFTLRGVRLSERLGGAWAQLAFRCAGFSMLEGAVGVCLPPSTPDAPSAAVVEALASGALAPSASVSGLDPATAAGDSLYFVTLRLSRAAASSAAASSAGGSSLWASSDGSGGASDASLSHLGISVQDFPQFDSAPGGEEGGAPRAGGAGAGSGAGLVVLSSVDGERRGGGEQRDGGEQRGGGGGEGACSGPPSSAGGCAAARSAGSFSSVCAGLVCRRIAGLVLGGQIAAGSYGRVYRGDYFGTKVAVKVLDGHAVLRRDQATGFSLEALLSEQLRHPNVVRTLAWAVVTGEGRLPARTQLWGETLQPDRPSFLEQRAAIAQQQQQQPGQQQQQQQAPMLLEGGGGGEGEGEGDDSGASAAQAAAAASLAEDSVDGPGAFGSEQDVLEGQTWLVLEYCDKGCLQDAIDRGWLKDPETGELNLLGVLVTAAEIASGMAQLHDEGIVHGDLSAFNVMLSTSDPHARVGRRGFVAKVADFGLSRTLNHASKVVTKTYGTVTHMPPEVLEHGLCSKAADCYSFGVLLWQMVCGSRAWAGLSHFAVINKVCGERARLVFPPDAPEALALLGTACMAYNPADRPSFHDILEILQPLNEFLVVKSANARQQQPQQQQQQQRGQMMVNPACARPAGGGGSGGDTPARAAARRCTEAVAASPAAGALQATGF